MKTSEKVIIAVSIALVVAAGYVGTHSYNNYKAKQQVAAQVATRERDQANINYAASVKAKQTAINGEITRLSNECKRGITKALALKCDVLVTD